jgi:hypothetical protein
MIVEDRAQLSLEAVTSEVEGRAGNSNGCLRYTSDFPRGLATQIAAIGPARGGTSASAGRPPRGGSQMSEVTTDKSLQTDLQTGRLVQAR